METEKIIEVVAALIWNKYKFMICQRPSNKACGLLWEFVGGKVEAEETKEQALIRECREELGVTLSVGNVFMDVIHEYPDVTIHLTLYNATIADGIPKTLEHNDIRWITPDEISQYEFCPADTVILKKIGDTSKMNMVEEAVQKRLLELQDIKYRDFQIKIIPTVDPKTVIGVRMPQLQKLAKEFAKSQKAEEFLKVLPHSYFEENNLHGLIIETIKDYGRVINALDVFLPYVDNWATCDLMRPKIFKKYLPELLIKIKVWLKSKHPYTIRFGIEMLMSYYLDEHFQPEYPELVAGVKSQDYYVNMMIAWYFATALAKKYIAVLPYIEKRRLDTWTHNKTIQKAIESYRITDEQKAYLRTLKIPNKV